MAAVRNQPNAQIVDKHEAFVGRASKGVDAGERFGKDSWLRWQGAGSGGGALAVQQRFGRRRPTLQVLARRRRESARRARQQLPLAPGGKAKHGGSHSQRRYTSIRPGAGFRAGYHEQSQRGAPVSTYVRLYLLPNRH